MQFSFVLLSILSFFFFHIQPQIIHCSQKVPYGSVNFYPYIHSFNMNISPTEFYRIQFSLCGNPVYCVNDRKFKKGAIVLYHKSECFVLKEWDSSLMFKNLKYFKPTSLKENPKFEIKENSSENNQYVNKITLSMQCHKKQFGNNNDVYLSDSELLINLSGNEYCPKYDELNVLKFFNENNTFFGSLAVIFGIYIGFCGFFRLKATFFLINSSLLILMFLIIGFEVFWPEDLNTSLMNYKLCLIALFGCLGGLVMTLFNKFNWFNLGFACGLIIYLNIYTGFGIYYIFAEKPELVLIIPLIIMAAVIGIYSAIKLSNLENLKVVKTRILFFSLAFGFISGYLLSRGVIMLLETSLYPNEFTIAYQKNIFPKNENAYLYGWGLQILFSALLMLFNFRQATFFELTNIEENRYLQMV